MNSNIFRECKIIYLSQKPSFLGQHENRHPKKFECLTKFDLWIFVEKMSKLETII